MINDDGLAPPPFTVRKLYCKHKKKITSYLDLDWPRTTKLFRHLSEEAPKGASLGLIVLYTVTSPHQLTDPLIYLHIRLGTFQQLGSWYSYFSFKRDKFRGCHFYFCQVLSVKWLFIWLFGLCMHVIFCFQSVNISIQLHFFLARLIC